MNELKSLLLRCPQGSGESDKICGSKLQNTAQKQISIIVIAINFRFIFIMFIQVRYSGASWILCLLSYCQTAYSTTGLDFWFGIYNNQL